MKPTRRIGRGFRRVLSIAQKEVMHLRRDPWTFYFALAMPVLLLVLFGYAVSFDIDRIPVFVVDQDKTPASRELLAHLFSGATFREAASVDAPSAAEQAFRRGEARIAVVIPRDYGVHVARGEQAEVQLLVDAADNQTAGNVLSYAGRFAVATNERFLRERAVASPPVIEARVRALYNPSLKSALFLVPGLIAMIQSMMAVLLTALTVAREWERGSMEQLFATPVSRLQIVLGKLIPYFGVALAQLLLVLTAATWLFDVPVRGSLALLFAVSCLFLLAMLGQGLFISVVTKNQMLATQIGAMTSLLPSLLLSGFILPIENMPLPLQLVTRIVPARYFVHAARALLLRGAGLSAVAGDALALAIFSSVIVAVCVARFKRRIA
jgi:ABC-2 type transport system permease protein